MTYKNLFSLFIGTTIIGVIFFVIENNKVPNESITKAPEDSKPREIPTININEIQKLRANNALVDSNLLPIEKKETPIKPKNKPNKNWQKLAKTKLLKNPKAPKNIEILSIKNGVIVKGDEAIHYEEAEISYDENGERKKVKALIDAETGGLITNPIPITPKENISGINFKDKSGQYRNYSSEDPQESDLLPSINGNTQTYIQEQYPQLNDIPYTVEELSQYNEELGKLDESNQVEEDFLKRKSDLLKLFTEY